jgi:hypothetical protein
MYVCMYARTYVRTYVCMYVCTYVRTFARTHARTYVCIVHSAVCWCGAQRSSLVIAALTAWMTYFNQHTCGDTAAVTFRGFASLRKSAVCSRCWVTVARAFRKLETPVSNIVMLTRNITLLHLQTTEFAQRNTCTSGVRMESWQTIISFVRNS